MAIQIEKNFSAEQIDKIFLIILLMMTLGLILSFIANLPSERFNITFSAFLGAAIITIRQQIKDYKDEKTKPVIVVFGCTGTIGREIMQQLKTVTVWHEAFLEALNVSTLYPLIKYHLCKCQSKFYKTA